MKTYSVFVSSQASTKTIKHNIRQYVFDWAIMPEGEYELTFTFVSSLQKLTTAEAESIKYPTKIVVSMPFSSERYIVSTDGNANSTQVLGLLEIDDFHTTPTHTMRQLKAGHLLNAPIKLYGKPSGNTFNVALLSHGNGDPITEHTPPYEMVINFKHIC